MRTTMPLSELFKRLFSIDVLAPEHLVFAGVAAYRLELSSTIQTLVSPDAAPNSIFLAVTASALRANSRPFLIAILNIQEFSLYTSHHTLKSASQKFL